jgi:hypothetical protein
MSDREPEALRPRTATEAPIPDAGDEDPRLVRRRFVGDLRERAEALEQQARQAIADSDVFRELARRNAAFAARLATAARALPELAQEPSPDEPSALDDPRRADVAEHVELLVAESRAALGEAESLHAQAADMAALAADLRVAARRLAR